MTGVLVIAALIWWGGGYLKVPARLRLILLGLLYLAVILAQVVLPEGNGLRQATGGSVQAWLTLGGVVALALAYVLGLRGLRQRGAARAAEPAPPAGGFRPAEIDRYARHIMLREIGGPGQKALKNARVLVIGAGGLGSPSLLYLAAAGVGTIGVIDDDEVDNSNLQRQVIHTDARIGMPKVFSAREAMVALNPFIEVLPYHRRLSDELAEELFAGYDLILDGSDNFDTRYLSNRIAVKTGKPLISAAITQWEGQISLFDPARGGPCYQCVFPERPGPGLVPTCAEAGVAAPLPGILGTMMANEAIKAITGAGHSLRGRMMIYDALYAEARVIGTKARPDCPVCQAGNPAGQPQERGA